MSAVTRARAARLALGFLVSAAFLAATLRQVDVHAAARHLLEAQPGWIAVGLGLVSIELVLRAARWQLLLRPFRVVPYRYAAGYLCIGYLANTVLPARLGDVARAVLAGRTFRIPRLATLGTIVVERIADGLVILALVLTFGLAVSGASSLVASAILIAATGAAGLAVLVGTAFIARRLRVHETRYGSAFVAFIHRIAVGAVALREPRILAIVIVLTLAAFGVAVGAFVGTSAAVGISVTPLEAVVVMGGLALSTALPAAPGSIGTYEFVGVTILAAFGVAAEPALATVLLIHAMALLLPSTVGLVTAWLVHFNVREVVPHPMTDLPGASAAWDA